MADKIITPSEFYKKLRKEDREAVVNLSEQAEIDFIPTGSWVLNALIRTNP